MLLARGDVQDRALGMTIATLAREHAGTASQLTVVSGGMTFEVVLRDGFIVAATSTHPDDRLGRIALAREWITPDVCSMVEKVCATSPAADELEVCTFLGELDAESALRLQRRAIAQRASRVVGLETGTYSLSATVTLPMREGTEMHVGGVVFQGAMLHVSEQRLVQLVGRLGSRFELAAAAVDELAYLGFGNDEAPIVRVLLECATFDRLVQLRGVEPRHTFAAVYALVATGLASSAPRLARGTQTPLGGMKHVSAPAPVTADNKVDDAASAFERGELALRAQRIVDAIVALERAVSLAPTNKRYATVLAWAKFCAAVDKGAAASDARKVLTRVASYHDGPIEALYYLGLMERILDRPARAEEHFREVLARMPDHVEAATELRFLSRRKR